MTLMQVELASQPFGRVLMLIVTTGVVAAAINVLCELARKSPQDYLFLAPRLFHLLTTSSNNWMLIKLVKLVCM